MISLTTHLAFVAASLSHLSLVLARLPPPAPLCQPKADHSNYGLQGKSWCPWDADHIWKPMGVGCKTDSECQASGNKCVFPYTNGHDILGINGDVLLITGYGYCDYSEGKSGPTECWCGAEVPQPHAGGNYNPPSHMLDFCREWVGKRGFTGLVIAAGCVVDDGVPQCMFKCNNSDACDKGDKPDVVHKTDPNASSCPGYPAADPPYT